MSPEGAEIAKRANRMHQLLALLREAEGDDDVVPLPRHMRRALPPARSR